MSQDKRILAIIEKIKGSNKYIETKINDTENTYIYHSEHEKNTCENCKALDNVKFYPGDLMIIPPLHPHCKCELEELSDNKVQTNSNNSLSGGIAIEVIPDKEKTTPSNKTNEQQNLPVWEFEIQNAKKELESSKEKLDEINSITKEINETIKKDIDFDFQILDEQITSIKPSFDMDLGILEEEKENHVPNCNELNKRINEVKTRKAEFEKIKNEVEDNKKKIDEIKNKLESIIHPWKSFMIDVQFFLEKMQEPWNFDNVAIKEVEELKQKIHALDCELNQYVKNIRALITSNNHLKEKLATLVDYSMQAIEQFKCSCASILDKTDKARRVATTDEVGKIVSTFNPIGGSNIQDAMHDFEYAKRNPNAEILNAGDKQNSKAVNATMKELGIPKEAKTVVYSASSSESRKLAHTPAIRNYIKTNIKELLNANGKPLKDEVLHHGKFQVDAYIGVQNFTLHNPRITKDGFFEAVVYDLYDFEYREEKSWIETLAYINPINTVEDILQKEANKLNNTGYNMQESGLLENYHVIYFIYEQLW